jgi:alkanesulfonate monooxygenase SsuD/methylene tetrahydromethanopterin reductase-like flavin-dependent oxidoreductase (luciferase family)
MEPRPSLTATKLGDGADHSRLLLGVTVPNQPGIDLVRQAQHAEALGFDVVTVHGDVMNGPQPTLEAWTSLAWVAATTTTVRLAPDVLVLPNRHPAVLAKMAETLDRLSGGRLVVALGGGAEINNEAFRAIGLELRSPRQQVEALEESLDVMRGLWEAPSFTYSGRYFQIAGGALRPRPDHRIPVWLGAFGARMLALTGRKADGWLPTLYWLPADAASASMHRVRAAAQEAGRDPDQLTYGYNVAVSVQEGAKPARGLVAGAPKAVAAQLAALARLGFNFLNLMPVGDPWSQRERLANDVVPLIRG